MRGNAGYANVSPVLKKKEEMCVLLMLYSLAFTSVYKNLKEVVKDVSGK